ncbi:dehydrogenase/reductase SDR family member 4-like [Dreissena polymorpha]|uniref:dehydrogenase/reductase SDR family member 4-like n=1 Tax=Dreissena polymorpha TaxID=45954 RepID=UPI0022640EA7|nr:dehydrogenase/reductase SDR family member 4-like [Dreissena polymorpha]
MKNKDSNTRLASSGIGEGVAFRLAGLGCRLSLTGRSAENLQRVAEACKEKGCTEDNVIFIPGDITITTDRKKIVERTTEAFGEINVLVNNAGKNIFKTELFNTNMKCHVFLTQLVLPFLIKTRMPEIGPFCMSTSSMDMFTQCLALEMVPHGVRVNSINPGTIVSSIARRSQGKHQEEELYQKFLSFQAGVHPLGRVGQPEDCAAAVAFLASDTSGFITGQILFVDGGRNCVSPGIAINISK